MAKFHKFIPILLLAIFCVQATAATKNKKARSRKPVAAAPAPPPLAPGELPLAATSAILLDGANGEAIYEKNSDQLGYPASATKILTALLVLETGDLDHEVIIELPDTKVEPSSLAFKPGERFTRRNLLYALLLKSANDSALALARDNAGSVEAFLAKMNQRAIELGATLSNFKNPHGLHHKEHYITARGMALIARTAMQHPFFRQIVSTKSYRICTDTGVVTLSNHNKLLTKLPDCTGVKTGYTIAAQQVLVSAAKRQNQEFIAVVLHTNKPGIWEDSRTLLLHAFEKFGLLPDAPPGPGCFFPRIALLQNSVSI